MFICLFLDLLIYILVFKLSTKELKSKEQGQEKMGVREEQRTWSDPLEFSSHHWELPCTL